MKELKEILKQLNISEIEESQEDIYAKEILDNINKWLKEESRKQDFIERNLRSDK